MASEKSNVTVMHLSGKLSNHFIFKLSADGNVYDRERVYCVHCDKQFAYRGSNTSLTYHLQHKHPMKYQHVVDRYMLKSSQVRPITNFVSYQSDKPVSAKVSEDLKVAIARWIASSGRPTAVVEDDGLQIVLRVALQNETYCLPSRRTIDTVIGQMYDEKLTEHKKAIENVHSIALATDFWTSSNNESYCGITGHWINSDWKLKSVALGCLLVDERHTAQNIANFYEEFAATWNITNKISCIVTDSARNMVAAIRQKDYSHIPCIAHCLQLSILAGLKAADISPLLAKCRHLVGHFKHSTVHNAQVELTQYVKEAPIPETEDPLMWWKLNKHRFPILSNFVQIILYVPATSVPCERLFSSSGYILNKMRSCLLPENVNALVCLRDWLK